MKYHEMQMESERVSTSCCRDIHNLQFKDGQRWGLTERKTVYINI